MVKKTWLKGKRGVSPLIATVLLIAFAVALGAVVMNWGQAQLQDQLTEGEPCSKVQIHWFGGDSTPTICSTDSAVEFTVQNGEAREINGLKVIIVGSNDIKTVESATGDTIPKADPKKITLAYEWATYGDIEDVQIIPKVIVGGESHVCPLTTAIRTKTVPIC